MAVRPIDVVGVLTEAEKIAVDAAEKALDKALKDHDWDGSFMWSAERFPGSKRAREELLKRYRNAGWIVSKSGGHASDDFYKFSAPSGGNSDYWGDK